jgi:hypothetical protein
MRRSRRKMRRTRRQRGGEFEDKQESLRKHIFSKFPKRDLIIGFTGTKVRGVPNWGHNIYKYDYMIWINKQGHSSAEYVGFINFTNGDLLTIDDKKDYVQQYIKAIKEWIDETYHPIAE